MLLNGKNDKLNGSVKAVRVDKKIIGEEKNELSVWSQEIEYDSHGRKQYEISYDGGGITLAENYFEYDVKGELVEARQYKPDGSLNHRKVYVRDGKKVEEIAYLANASVGADKTVHLLDAFGKQIGLQVVNSRRGVTTELIIEYDSEGLVREITMYADIRHGMIINGGRPAVVSDDLLRRIKDASPHSNRLPTSRTTFSYNEFGDVVETSIHAYNSFLANKEVYAREYDLRRNWIKETRSLVDLATNALSTVEITYRQITYVE